MAGVIKFSLSALLLLLMFALAASGLLLGTQEGTRLLVAAAERFSAGTLRVESVYGHLLDDLELSGIRLRLRDKENHIGRLYLRWRPAALRQGLLRLEALQLSDIRLDLPPTAEDPPQTQSGFDPADLPLALHLDAVELTAIQIHRAGQEPFQLERITVAATLVDGQLSLSELQLSGPDGSLRAAAEARLAAPYPVRATLDWQWRFPATGPLEGHWELRGDSERLQVTHQGRGALPLDLGLTLSDALGETSWQGRLHWPAFQPPEKLGVAGLRLSAGELHSEGSLNGYQLALSLAHAGAGLPDMAWTLQGRGNRRHLNIGKLQLELLEGSIRGDARLDWLPQPKARLKLVSSGLDLSTLAPDLPPALDGELALEARRDGRQWLLERLNLTLPDVGSRLNLHGQADLSQPEAPALTARLDWSGLRWPLTDSRQSDTPQIDSTKGSLTLNGGPDAYHGELRTDLITPKLGAVHLRLKGNGDRQGLHLEQALAELLSGTLKVRGELGWGQGPSADLVLAARSLNPAPLVPGWPQHTLLSADGGLAYDGRRVLLKALRLHPQPGTGRITLDGWAEPADQPLATGLNLQLDWSALSWPLHGTPTLAASPAGTLKLTGTPAAYRLEGRFELTGQDIPPGNWTLSAGGNPTAMTLDGLHGDILRGTVDLSGQLAWSERPQWDLELLAKAIDPAPLLPQLPGSLTLTSHLRGHLDAQGRPHAELGLRKLQGHLLDRPLKLRGKLAVAGDRYRLRGLKLSSGRNRAELNGGLDNGKLDLDWKLALPEPAGLLPGVSGDLRGQGRLGGSLQAPTLSASIQGKDLGLDFGPDRLKLRTLAVELDTTLSDTAALQMQIQADGLKRGKHSLLNQATMQLTGRMDQHRLTLDLQTPAEQLQAVLQGKALLKEPAWRGNVQQLTLNSSGLGNWRLTDPAALALAAEQAELGQTCLAHTGSSGRLCASLDHLAGKRSQLALELKALAVNELLPAVDASLSARLNGSLSADGRLRAEAAAQLSDGALRVQVGGRQQRLIHRGGSLEAVVNDAGLNGQLRLSPLQQGHVNVELKLPALNRLPLTEDQPIEGSVKAHIPDLTPLQAFVPQLTNTGGTLEADMALHGRLPVPGIQGAVELKNGAADVPLVGMKLRQLGLKLHADPKTPGRWLLSGGAESGGGSLSLDGAGGIDGRDVRLHVEGRDFSVVDITHARVRLDPDLRLAWNGERLQIRGHLHIPLADLTPQLELAGELGDEAEQPNIRGRAITASSDVVMLRPEGEPATEPTPPRASTLPLDSEVVISLGEAVQVDAVGFRSRIAGELTLINPPGRPDLIPLARGQLSLAEGAYRSFGQDLEIDPNSQLLFNGGPVTAPELQLRAIRWIHGDDQVNAVGVHISGTLDAPRVDLFSEPQLDEQTIHSYLLTGKGPNSNEQMLSVGTRLSEDVYVGYGINLLEQTHEFNLRYDILRWFALEADVGEADKSLTFSYTLER